MSVRWHWGTGIATVYAVFAAATAAFVVFAMDQRVELVSADYYQRAIDHDRRMAAVSNAAALNDAFRVDASADGRTVTLDWTAARPDKGAGEITLYRASDDRLDRTMTVAPDTLGRQQVSLGSLPAGHWLVQVQWRAGGREYYVEHAVTAR